MVKQPEKEGPGQAKADPSEASAIVVFVAVPGKKRLAMSSGEKKKMCRKAAKECIVTIKLCWTFGGWK